MAVYRDSKNKKRLYVLTHLEKYWKKKEDHPIYFEKQGFNILSSIKSIHHLEAKQPEGIFFVLCV